MAGTMSFLRRLLASGLEGLPEESVLRAEGPATGKQAIRKLVDETWGAPEARAMGAPDEAMEAVYPPLGRTGKDRLNEVLNAIPEQPKKPQAPSEFEPRAFENDMRRIRLNKPPVDGRVYGDPSDPMEGIVDDVVDTVRGRKQGAPIPKRVLKRTEFLDTSGQEPAPLKSQANDLDWGAIEPQRMLEPSPAPKKLKTGKWSPSEMQTLTDLWHEGAGAGRIGRMLNRSRSDVIKKVHVSGLAAKRVNPRVAPELAERAPMQSGNVVRFGDFADPSAPMDAAEGSGLGAVRNALSGDNADILVNPSRADIEALQARMRSEGKNVAIKWSVGPDGTGYAWPYSEGLNHDTVLDQLKLGGLRAEQPRGTIEYPDDIDLFYEQMKGFRQANRPAKTAETLKIQTEASAKIEELTNEMRVIEDQQRQMIEDLGDQARAHPDFAEMQARHEEAHAEINQVIAEFVRARQAASKTVAPPPEKLPTPKTRPAYQQYTSATTSRMITLAEELSAKNGGTLPRGYAEKIAEMTGHQPESIVQIFSHARNGRYGEELQARAIAMGKAKSGRTNTSDKLRELSMRGMSSEDTFKEFTAWQVANRIKPSTRKSFHAMMSKMRKEDASVRRFNAAPGEGERAKVKQKWRNEVNDMASFIERANKLVANQERDGLASFVRKFGDISDDRGDIADLEDLGRGASALVRSTGQELDYVIEEAVARGYFPKDRPPTRAEFIDALRRDLARPEERLTEEAKEARAALDYYDQLGIDTRLSGKALREDIDQFLRQQEGGDSQLNMFFGPKSKKADHAKHAVAMRLEKAGIPMKDIRAQTGWWRAADGQWRAGEFADDGLKVRLDATLDGQWRRLDQIIEHPELFEHYPGARKVMARAAPQGGVYRRTKQGPQMQARRDSPDYWAHEIQHYIQDVEDWATGGTEALFQDPSGAIAAKQAYLWRGLIDDLPTGGSYAEKEARLIDLLKREGAEAEIPDDAVRTLARDRGAHSDENLYNRMRLFGLHNSDEPDTPIEAYNRLHGEWEARKTQNRQRMDQRSRDEFPAQYESNPNDLSLRFIPDDPHFQRPTAELIESKILDALSKEDPAWVRNSQSALRIGGSAAAVGATALATEQTIRAILAQQLEDAA